MRHEKLTNRFRVWIKKPRRFLLRFDFLCTKTDFLLRISSLSKRHQSRFAGSHYPPPGYGVPPGKTLSHNAYTTQHQYGLYLMTGKIRLWLMAYALMAVLMLLPTISMNKNTIDSDNSHFSIGDLHFFLGIQQRNVRKKGTEDELQTFDKREEKKGFDLVFKKPSLCYGTVKATCYENYIFYLLIFAGLSYIFYRIVYYFMPPVLNNVWKFWPLTAYRQFLSVPHFIELKGKDNDIHHENDLHLFWRPDKQAWRYRQSTEYAKGAKSLQEVILDMAFFEMFFNKKANQQNGGKVIQQFNTINVNNAFWYLLSPVWGNYFLLVLSSLIFLMFYGSNHPTGVDSLFLKYPYSFIPALICWFVISVIYITKLFKDLDDMREKIASGYYQSHFDLVPQQILVALTDIPTARQIRLAVKQLRITLNVMGGVAVVVFLAMLEVIGGGIQAPGGI